jgi:nucleotide-binding universal stress UspA family protein
MFKKILAAVDGSDASIQALDYAAYLADQNNAELKIVSAVEPLPKLYAAGSAQAYHAKHMEIQEENYKKTHQEQRKRLNDEYPNLKISAVIETGRPATIIREASQDTDLIVIGHRGQGGVLSWVLGSVAKQIVDSCTVPVLVIKDREYCPA